MSLMSWAKSLVKKMTIWDMSLLKTTMFLFGIIVGAYIADFVKLNILYFAIATGILYLVLVYRVFR